MDKSFLEKKLEERASIILRDEKDNAEKLVREDPILKDLKIRVGDKEFSLYQVIFFSDRGREYTNLDVVLQEREQKILEKVSNELVNKVKEIEYFLENQGEY
jgi:hypothetical protein